MISKERSSKPLSNTLLEASAWVLFSAGICAFSGAKLVNDFKSLFTDHSVYLETVNPSWIAEAHLHTQAVLPDGTDVLLSQSSASADREKFSMQLEQERASAKALAHHLYRRPSTVVKAIAKNRTIAAPKQPQSQCLDAIAVSSAVALTTQSKVEASSQPLVTADTVVEAGPIIRDVNTQPAFYEAKDTELETMKRITQNTRMAFKLAMESAPSTEVDSLLASLSQIEKEELDLPWVELAPVLAQAKPQLTKKSNTTHHSAVPLIEEKEVATVVVQEPLDIQPAAKEAKTADIVVRHKTRIDSKLAVKTASTDQLPALSTQNKDSHTQSENGGRDPDHQKLSAIVARDQNDPDDTDAGESVPDSKTSQRSVAAMSFVNEETLPRENGILVRKPMDTHGDETTSQPGRWIVSSAKPDLKKSTPSHIGTKYTQSPNASDLTLTQAHPILLAGLDQTESDADSEDAEPSVPRRSLFKEKNESKGIAESAKPTTLLETRRWTGIEAFEWKAELGVSSYRFAQERGAKESREWRIAEATNHIRTLYFTESNPAEPKKVPLLSNNSLLLLAAKLGVKAQKSMGVVFGLVAPGQELEFSGRAEKLQTFSGPDGATAFIWLNVEPGVHLVYSRSGGSVATPVLEGGATFLDLTQTRRQKIQGWVLDGSEGSAKPRRGVTVKVVGQAGAVTMTGADGSFSIDQVQVFGKHSVHLETVVPNEYKHRYRVASDALSNAELFRFSPQRIEGWVHQLDGDVNPSSGIAIAAFPRLQAELGGNKLLSPKIKPVLKSATIAPETYALAADDRLMAGVPLSGRSPRFVGVQLPEGLCQAALRDESQSEVWSELLISSPGVVNVIGPN